MNIEGLLIDIRGFELEDLIELQEDLKELDSVIEKELSFIDDNDINNIF